MSKSWLALCRRFTLLWLGLTAGVSASLTWQSAALAEALPPATEALDPLVPGGILLTVTGASMASLGGVLLASDDNSYQVCGVVGSCVDIERDTASSVFGGVLLAGGLPLAATGILELVVGGWSTARAARWRRANAGAVAGVWLVGWGLSAVGVGVSGLVGTGAARYSYASLVALGGAMTGVGAPLTIVEATSHDGEAEEAPRSSGRLYAGMAISTIGMLALEASAFPCNDHRLCIGPLIATSAALAVGVSLWVTGAQRGDEDDVRVRVNGHGNGLSLALEY